MNVIAQRLKLEISLLTGKKGSNPAQTSALKQLQKKFEDIDAYLDFYQDSRKKLNISTNKKIVFGKNISLGCNNSRVKRSLFFPAAEMYGNGLLKTQILSYATHVMGYPAGVEFHFYGNELFLIECNFGDTSEDERETIIHILQQEYNAEIANTEIQKISNNTGQCISIENQESMKVYFADLSHAFFSELSNIEIFYNKEPQKPAEEKVLSISSMRKFA